MRVYILFFMALINESSPHATGDELSYWNDQLINTRDLIFELQKKISRLQKEDKQNYSIDTGQTSQSVKRAETSALERELAGYRKQELEILDIINRLQDPGGSFVQVIPV